MVLSPPGVQNINIKSPVESNRLLLIRICSVFMQVIAIDIVKCLYKTLIKTDFEVNVKLI